MTGFTLEWFTWLAIFVVFGGFLCVTAYIFEQAEPDPISPDDRNQAHPIHTSGDPFTTWPEVPLRAGVGVDGSPDLRERIAGQATGE